MVAVLTKILVANRGEIAIRAFRSAAELGARTVAVFPWEDRNAEHRARANEAYLIGERGHPVHAYLDIDEITRVAAECGADAVYPGYGFLSENPDLAQACADRGLTFIGPPAPVLELAGDKVRAVAAAATVGIPVLRSSAPSDNLDELVDAAGQIGFPLFVKAVAGGGGRGMRRVSAADELPAALRTAMREAAGAFGNPTVFCEQAVLRPRHIEVQVLGDHTGEVVHLHERDCSVQRRHQKIIEVAPARAIDPALRDRLHADAVAFARAIGYVNAGTVEFLVETAGPDAGRHVFIEMNPRIQVEHTITEEITDVDLVAAQLRLAAGATLADLELTQDRITVRGAAVQCRITTEDPANEFRPDTGQITSYRSPGGAGIRLDGGTVYTGAVVSPHFDSLLVKVIARGADHDTAVRRARRALGEFRVRGVNTNTQFLQAVLAEPAFAAGELTTSFIDERPRLADAPSRADRGTKLLTWLADVTVNQPHGPARLAVSAADKLPALTGHPAAEVDPEWKSVLDQQGPRGFAATLRAYAPLAVADTTFRDAHQSLLATRVRTRDLVAVGPHLSRMVPQLLAVECWGGATYDVALRFLGEDPWERLAALRTALPRFCLQMLLRGRNTVGYTPYPTEVTEAFVRHATATGVDIFRIFDALNDVDQMRPAIDAVRATGTAVAEAALCYTGDLLDPGERVYTLDYYLRLAEQISTAGADVIAIKDMAGLLRPAAARLLVAALRERFDAPVRVHTHDTAGGQLATLLAAAEAGADAVDAASAPMAGATSQPSMSALVAALAHTERDTGLQLRAVTDLEPYWEAVRRTYAPFESGTPAPTGRVYDHEIPGGQLSNLRQQAIALGLGERFEQIEDMYAAADRILGRLVKVTPSSKVVGDLALHLVATGADPAEFAAHPDRFDIPDSVLGFLSGELGDPPGGWPEPFRTRALAGRHRPRPAAERALAPADAQELAEQPTTALNRLLFPGPAREFAAVRDRYGDLGVLDTLDYLYGLRPGVEHAIELGRGVRVLVTLQAIGEPDERGMRTVMCTFNGQLRPVRVRDRAIAVEVRTAEKADPNRPGEVAAPFSGVVSLAVAEGDAVAAGQAVATIEAMKMEASITTPVGGTVRRLATGPVQQVESGDLIVVVEP